jgi:hypothetical protein
MSSSRNPVSHRGMLKNMLNQSFTGLDSLRELIEDSLGAEASAIHLTIKTDQALLILSDNGIGMTKSGLDSAHVFHNRGRPSNRKHGRFGIGRKNALVVLTGLKHSVDTFSSPKEDVPRASPGSVYELIADFPEWIELDNIDVRATGITSARHHIWDTYKLPESHGTVSYIPCDTTVFKKLVDEGFRSTSPDTNIYYILSYTYAKFLAEGGSIVVDVDGVQTSLVPVEFLDWENIPAANRVDRTLHLYRDPIGEVYAYYTGRNDHGNKGLYAADGLLGCMNFEKDARSNTFEEGEPPVTFTFMGSVRFRSAYTDDWVERKRDILIRYGILIPNRGEDGRQAFEKALCGTILSRNGKVVVRFPNERPTSGDKARYPISEKSNHEISFQAIVSETEAENTLDDVFGILVNKSKVNESQIEMHVRNTIRHLQDKFISEQYKSVRSVEDIDTVAGTVATPATTATTVMQQPIPAHSRQTPISRRFILNYFADFLDHLQGMDADPASFLRACAMQEPNVTEEGLTKIKKDLDALKTMIQKYREE